MSFSITLRKFQLIPQILLPITLRTILQITKLILTITPKTDGIFIPSVFVVVFDVCFSGSLLYFVGTSFILTHIMSKALQVFYVFRLHSDLFSRYASSILGGATLCYLMWVKDIFAVCPFTWCQDVRLCITKAWTGPDFKIFLLSRDHVSTSRLFTWGLPSLQNRHSSSSYRNVRNFWKNSTQAAVQFWTTS